MNKFSSVKKKITAKGCLTLAIIVLAGCATPRPTPQAIHREPVLAENVYLANNIHAERKGGIFRPVTPIGPIPIDRI